MKLIIPCCITLYLCGLISGYIIRGTPPQSPPSETVNPVPTIQEIQKLIGAPQDGIMGPETIRLWNRAVCDQFAAPYFPTRKD